jgi:hypothetical protein
MIFKRMSRRTFIIVSLVLATLAAFVVISNVVYLVHQSQAAGNRVIVKSSATQHVVTIPVQSPPSAEAVAKRLHCDSFKHLGPAMQGMVLDSGSCFIGHQKYAIDVFPSKAGRDQWLQIAKYYGVRPHWETSTWVVYRSVG